MVRLTPDLVKDAPAFTNPCGLRELDLRDNGIQLIENLAITQDQFDSIDLSNNAIRKVANIPRFNLLKNIYLCNNRVASVAKDLHEYIPNLETLIFTNNRVSNLDEIVNLSNLENLKVLSLLENGVARLPNYRLFTIYVLRSLVCLDFKRVDAKRSEGAHV
eukprot:TRINITY_DN98_c0_g1_i1.p1 TRINITY_DN98_c0_g1~~TRINITY_DN98_c0_g1_i1.p1  ORF type:complete len:161 (+),score=36.63 TRINITY_DN98_c0_g1_i1:60-542(+)